MQPSKRFKAVAKSLPPRQITATASFFARPQRAEARPSTKVIEAVSNQILRTVCRTVISSAQEDLTDKWGGSLRRS